MSNRRERRRSMRTKTGTHTSICVVCSKPIPRRHVALWVVDSWTGRIFGAHVACGDGQAGGKAMMAGLKAAMTTPEWVRFRWRQVWAGRKRLWGRWAARWTTSPKVVD